MSNTVNFFKFPFIPLKTLIIISTEIFHDFPFTGVGGVIQWENKEGPIERYMQYIGYHDGGLLHKTVTVNLWVKFLKVCHKKKGRQFGIGAYGNFDIPMHNCQPDEWMHVVVEKRPKKKAYCGQVIFHMDDVKVKGRIIQIAQMTVEVEGKGKGKDGLSL